MQETLSEWVQSVPDSTFWKDQPGGAADHRNVFTLYFRQKYPAGMIPVGDIETGRIPNPSTFQRTVAKEASRRRTASLRANRRPLAG